MKNRTAKYAVKAQTALARVSGPTIKTIESNEISIKKTTKGRINSSDANLKRVVPEVG
jgi:hypothetical protein